jgi:hypothetical protein
VLNIVSTVLQRVNASVACISLYVQQSHKDSIRASILDVRENVNVTQLAEKAQIIAEALARHIFNLTSGEVFSSSLVSVMFQVVGMVL